MGQTTRHLHTRVSEHLGMTPLTGKQCENPSQSSIFSHLNSTGHTASIEDFKILSSCPDSHELLIHESLSTFKAAQFPFTYSDLVLYCLSFVCMFCPVYVFLICTTLPHPPLLPFLILTFSVPLSSCNLILL